MCPLDLSFESGSHICQIYETFAEQKEVILPYSVKVFMQRQWLVEDVDCSGDHEANDGKGDHRLKAHR